MVVFVLIKEAVKTKIYTSFLGSVFDSPIQVSKMFDRYRKW